MIGVPIHYAVVSIMEGGAKLLIHQVSIVGLHKKDEKEAIYLQGVFNSRWQGHQ